MVSPCGARGRRSLRPAAADTAEGKRVRNHSAPASMKPSSAASRRPTSFIRGSFNSRPHFVEESRRPGTGSGRPGARPRSAVGFSDEERRVMRQAGGIDLELPVLSLHRQRLARRRPVAAAATRPASGGRNHDWGHLYCRDVMSMPDKWEYPWFAAWDLAFHTIAYAMMDPEFAKRQLELVMSERFMHPNGQIPAYEWAFGDVNPPVHGWAAFRLYKTMLLYGLTRTICSCRGFFRSCCSDSPGG